MRQPSSEQLNQLAGSLANVHHSDLHHTLGLITEFGYTINPEDRDAEPQRPESLDGIRKITEQARTLFVVHASAVKAGGQEFISYLGECGRLLDEAHDFFFAIGQVESRSKAAKLVCNQLERIATNLGTEGSATPSLDPLAARMARTIARPGLLHLMKDKATIAAAVCLAFLLWDISSDGLPLWQIIAAVLLVATICAAGYRLGRLQTPVLSFQVVSGKDGNPGTVAR